MSLRPSNLVSHRASKHWRSWVWARAWRSWILGHALKMSKMSRRHTTQLTKRKEKVQKTRRSFMKNTKWHTQTQRRKRENMQNKSSTVQAQPNISTNLWHLLQASIRLMMIQITTWIHPCMNRNKSLSLIWPSNMISWLPLRTGTSKYYPRLRTKENMLRTNIW